ncbi:MAG: response regulator transcription factor [Magnetococcales bacterium]|nr:response regulator transcription factor [Magnetococcales bacterium]MBF0157378.1 response regulator transcription factor [Magnetococcales bacterium]
MRCLIVDDDRELRALLRIYVEDAGCEVVAEAGDGAEGIRLYRYHLPDLTLMDLMMPEKNGIEAIEAIKATHPDAYVVMLTSVNDLFDITAGFAVGADGYLRKGMVDLHDQLLKAIAERRKLLALAAAKPPAGH